MEADYVTAVRLVLRHAQAGNSDAQCAMALLYEAGWGVPRDVEKAKQWLIKAAEQDNPVAWNNLGTYYAQEGHKRIAHQCFERAKQLGLQRRPSLSAENTMSRGKRIADLASVPHICRSQQMWVRLKPCRYPPASPDRRRSSHPLPPQPAAASPKPGSPSTSAPSFPPRGTAAPAPPSPAAPSASQTPPADRAKPAPAASGRR